MYYEYVTPDPSEDDDEERENQENEFYPFSSLEEMMAALNR